MADNPMWIFAPGHRLFGIQPNSNRLPRITGNKDTNETIWNTVGTTVALTGVAALATVIANRMMEKDWDKKKVEAHKNKVNALQSINTPNYASESEEVERVRNIGLEDGAKKLKKSARLLSEAGKTVVPLLVGIPAAIGMHKALSADLVDEREGNLDKEIESQRNKLDALYAKLLDMHEPEKIATPAPLKLLENRTPTAALDVSDAGIAKKAGLPGSTAAVLTAIALGIPLVSGMAAYHFTRHVDENRKKTKILKDLMAANLTNVPASVDIALGEEGNIPEFKDQQTYIDDFNRRVLDASRPFKKINGR